MKKRYQISDLDCAHCAAKMEEAIRGMEGVNSVSVSVLTQKLVLDAEDSRFDDILRAALAACKKIEPDCTIHI